MPGPTFELEIDRELVVSAKMRESEVREVDKLWRSLGFENRSQFIRELIRLARSRQDLREALRQVAQSDKQRQLK